MLSGYVCYSTYNGNQVLQVSRPTDPSFAGQTQNYDELSLWTPLHQAAYMRAPVTVISQLLEHGAFRTIHPLSLPGIPGC